jgi:hypothetical protein
MAFPNQKVSRETSTTRKTLVALRESVSRLPLATKNDLRLKAPLLL